MDIENLVSIEEITGEDAEETALLQEMGRNAIAYLSSFHWCPGIASGYLGYGVGGVMAAFLFNLNRKVAGTDDWLWAVVGDLPSAYFVTDEATTAAAALEAYCGLMDDWCSAVEENRPLNDVFLVRAAPTLEHARMLRSRLKYIRDVLVPQARL